MGITREVTTEVWCDVCGEYIKGWISQELGVSKGWAAYHARQTGATVGDRVTCKNCRIKQRIKKCALIKEYGSPGMDNEACLGFGTEHDDEPIEKCKNCIACTSFDWKEEAHRLSIDERRNGR